MNETIESIVREDARFDRMPTDQVLRIGRDYQNKDGYYRGAHYDTVKLLCDTIEHLQDQIDSATAEKSLVVGNAAKMREALEEICDFLDPVRKYGHPEEGDKEPGAMFALAEMIGKRVDEALNAPIRNCDLYPDWEEAYLKWVTDVQEVDPAYVFDIGDDTHERVEESWGIFAQDQNREFVDWYMSPAELDTKGGAE